MATLEDRLQTIADYVQTYTGRQTFIADSNFTQPATPYCTVKLINANHYDHDFVNDPDGFSQTVQGMAKLDYSIQAIGGDEVAGTGATKALKRLILSLRANLPREDLLREEIGVQEVGDVLDISSVVGSNIEDRASVIIGFSASMEETFAFETAIKAGVEVDAGLTPTDQLVVPTEPPDCPAG